MNLSLAWQPDWLHRRNGNLLGFVWCVGLMAYALFVQYGLHEEPCPLCILQRVSVIATGCVFFAALVQNPGKLGGRIYSGLIAITTLAGVGVAARQVWIIHQPPGSVAECGASLEYMMDVLPLHEVLGKVLSGSGECAKVTWRFLGLSMPFWVLVNLLGLLALGFIANVLLRRRG